MEINDFYCEYSSKVWTIIVIDKSIWKEEQKYTRLIKIHKRNLGSKNLYWMRKSVFEKIYYESKNDIFINITCII